LNIIDEFLLVVTANELNIIVDTLFILVEGKSRFWPTTMDFSLGVTREPHMQFTQSDVTREPQVNIFFNQGESQQPIHNVVSHVISHVKSSRAAVRD
jgi:hypothetical protein